MTDTAIVITLCNRPEYTSKVFEGLCRCEGIEDYPVYLMCEPINKHVKTIAQHYANKFPGVWHAIEYKNRVGCNINTAYALTKGFAVADRVIALEDDTVPGRDFLKFCKWGLDAYEDDKSVFSISGYQRTEFHELYRTSEVIRENWFTPWGWATWRDRWESVAMGWPARDDQISWDTVIHKAKLGHRCEIRPIVARIQNIGAIGGAHVPNAEWHKEHHLNEHWIETTSSPCIGLYHEVPADSTNALRRNHPC